MSMRMQLARISMRSLKQRGAYALVACGLALTLALGGCGARSGSGVATQQTTSGTTSGASTGATTGGSANSAAIQQLQGVDSQNQSDASQLSAAQNDAGTNFSTQENETQP